VHQPDAPEKPIPPVVSKNSALILCEGLWGMDNSSLHRYDLTTGTIVNDYFESANPGLRIGDLANNLVLSGDTGYIAVTTAKTIERFRASSGLSLGRLILTGNNAPRQICIIDSTTGFFTDLYANSVCEFNPSSMQIKTNIPVGPAPEGITGWGNYVYIANSGYGDYLADKPKAGTISVIDVQSGQVVNNIPAGPNVIELKVDYKNNRLFAAYYNLPSKKDSVGGIIEYALPSLQVINHWRIAPRSITLSATGDTLFFLANHGVAYVRVNESLSMPQMLMQNIITEDHWYSLAISPDGKSLWVCNARNYQINGEVLVFDIANPVNPKIKIPVGVNPNTVVFY
jgi:DNA-binding beta-propeller fold protein YncE